jgi:hypothetical protein
MFSTAVIDALHAEHQRRVNDPRALHRRTALATRPRRTAPRPLGTHRRPRWS